MAYSVCNNFKVIHFYFQFLSLMKWTDTLEECVLKFLHILNKYQLLYLLLLKSNFNSRYRAFIFLCSRVYIKIITKNLTHWVRVFAGKPDYLGLITWTHKMEENWPLQVVLWLPHVCYNTQVPQLDKKCNQN